MSDRTPRPRRDASEIGDALRNVGDRYVQQNPADLRALRQSMAKARRKRRFYLGGSAVAATAAIGLLFVVARPSLDRVSTDVAEQPSAAETLRVTQRVSVDGVPSQIASNENGAYVTVPDDGTVIKIGAESGEVDWSRDIEGRPEDIIAGEFAVWVTDPATSRIHALSFKRGVATQSPIQVTRGVPLRLSVGSTSVRISTENGPAYRIDFDGRDGLQLGQDVAWEIAHLNGLLWVLTPEGLIYPIDDETGEQVTDFQPLQVFEPGEFSQETAGEITAAHGAIWYGREGDDTVTRIEAADGSTSTISLPAPYRDLDGDGQGGMWVLLGTGDAGELIEIDDETGALLPRSIRLSDEPVDIAASGDGVWIVLEESHEVLHVNDAVEGTL